MPDAVTGLLTRAQTELAEAGVETPRLDAELLLAEVLGVGRDELIAHSERVPDALQGQEFVRSLQRRVKREPVAYIIGRRHFRRLELAVDRNVLISRPETELLVEVALELPSGASVIDVGTGSGAIALALKDERPDLDVWASDSDAAALTVARANARRLGLAVEFRQVDLLENAGRAFDAVVSNPPYVTQAEYKTLQPEITEYEPRSALVAGEDGLEIYRRLTGQLEGIGYVALELGDGQAGAVRQLLSESGFGEIEVCTDLAGIERVIVGKR